MKKFQKIISLILSAVFLFSSLGFTISKMSCLKTGKTELSLVALDDCCLKKTDANCCEQYVVTDISTKLISFSKKDCCAITNTSFDLNDFYANKKSNIPAASCNDLIALPNNILTTSCAYSIKNFLFADLPVPLHGRELLSLISVLII